MLQRQQASAIIAARTRIVEGAVGMVEMALERLNQKGIVHLDEERKAAMVSNLLVVLCGERAVDPFSRPGIRESLGQPSQAMFGSGIGRYVYSSLKGQDGGHRDNFSLPFF